MKRTNTFIILLICTTYILCTSSCTFLSGKPADHTTLVNSIIRNSALRLSVNDSLALPYLDSAFQYIPSPQSPGDRYAFYEFKRAYYTDNKINYNKALLYADSMVWVLKPVSTEAGYNLLYCNALLKKGDALFSLKKYAKAYSAFYKAMMSILPENARDKARFFFEYNKRLADISYGKSLFLDAAFWHQKALKSLNAIADTNLFYAKQGCLNNLALSYSMAGRLDSAEKYYDQALQVIDSFRPATSHQMLEKEIGMGVVLGNLGTVYFNQGKTALAEQSFKESISINAKPTHAREDAQITRIKLAALYTATGRLKEATMVMQQIMSSPDTLTNVLNKLELLILQANYASTIGHNTQANQLYRLFIHRMDSLRASKNALMSADFSSEFEVLQQQYEFVELKRQYQLNIVLLVVAIVVCIMAICIVLLIYRSKLRDKLAAHKLSRRYGQLEMTLAALEQSNQQNAQFHRVLAHDLKNPIGAIYSITQLMSDNNNRSDEDKEMLELIQLSSKNAINLIHDQLIDKGKTLLHGQAKASVELSELLQESVSLLQYKAEEKRQRIFLEPPTGSCTIPIHRESIWRVLNNLLVNAIKFSKEEQLIEVGYNINDHEVVIFVKDKGIGVPDALKGNLFLLSSEIKRKGTIGEESFGLGLYTSRQIIEDHGGKIWHEDNENGGSIFRFSLPLS